jgi:hypothetical protein
MVMIRRASLEFHSESLTFSINSMPREDLSLAPSQCARFPLDQASSQVTIVQRRACAVYMYTGVLQYVAGGGKEFGILHLKCHR